jgi:ABC-type multidrug transport system ATPase subunit
MIGIEFFSSKNQDISFFDLSDGEKRLLSQLIEVQYELLKSAPNYILLLDEPDTSLHPDWNKEFINLLLQVINSTKTIHFIISSHSPFILSDLPKENVIFLEKDEKTGECINATNRVNLNTFGANIHTLLSHGFFMRDGLMSKFAKGKIDKAIKYLNQKSLSKEEIDYCENIISIIGEPILKQQLQKILDSKRLNKMDEIDRLKADISELYQKLKKLEGRK